VRTGTERCIVDALSVMLPALLPLLPCPDAEKPGEIPAKSVTNPVP